MHETGIVKDLVHRLEKAAIDASARRVSGAHVWLGALSQFSAEHFACISRKRRAARLRKAQNSKLRSRPTNFIPPPCMSWCRASISRYRANAGAPHNCNCRLWDREASAGATWRRAGRRVSTVHISACQRGETDWVCLQHQRRGDSRSRRYGVGHGSLCDASRRGNAAPCRDPSPAVIEHRPQGRRRFLCFAEQR